MRSITEFRCVSSTNLFCFHLSQIAPDSLVLINIFPSLCPVLAENFVGVIADVINIIPLLLVGLGGLPKILNEISDLLSV